MNRDIDHCTGEGCPLKMSCYRYIDWMAKDDDDDPEVWMVEPAYGDGKCNNYYQRLYYGG